MARRPWRWATCSSIRQNRADRNTPIQTQTFRIGMVEMLRGAWATRASQVVRLVRELPAALGTVAGTAKGVLSPKNCWAKARARSRWRPPR
jgi:hypothetical protein